MGAGYGQQKSGTKATYGPIDVTPSEYKGLRTSAFSGLEDIIETGGGAKWKGPYIAPITGEETGILEYLMEMFEDPGANYGSAERLLGDTLEGDYLDPESNPFIDDYVRAAQRSVRETYDAEEQDRRALFARAGHQLPESSPFSEAQGIANRGLANSLGDIATNLYGATYEAERGRQMEALAEQRAYLDQRWQAAMENLEAQALPRLIEQYGIDKAYAEFARRQGMLIAALEIASGATQPIFGQEGKSSSTGTGYNVSASTGGAFGAGGAGTQ